MPVVRVMTERMGQVNSVPRAQSPIQPQLAVSLVAKKVDPIVGTLDQGKQARVARHLESPAEPVGGQDMDDVAAFAQPEQEALSERKGDRQSQCLGV